MRLQTRILFCGGFDLIHKNGFLAMADRVVEIHIMSQISIHVADEGKEGCHADSARDPDLLLSASFIVKHAVRAFDDRIHACLQIAEKMTCEISAGFDRDTQYILLRRAGYGEGM